MVHASDWPCSACDRKSRPMTVSISNCLRFNFGKRSVPPATNIARGPRSAAMRAASRAVFGRRYLNRGRRSTVQLFGWRFDFDRCWIRDVWEPLRAVASRFAFVLAPQRFDDLLRRDRDLVDPHAKRIEHRRADGGNHRQQWTLTCFFGAVRSFGVVGLDEVRLDVGHIQESR